MKVGYELIYSGRIIDTGELNWPIDKKEVVILAQKLATIREGCRIEVSGNGVEKEIVIYLGRSEHTGVRVYASPKNNLKEIIVSGPFLEFYEADNPKIDLAVREDDRIYGPDGLRKLPDIAYHGLS